MSALVRSARLPSAPAPLLGSAAGRAAPELVSAAPNELYVHHIASLCLSPATPIREVIATIDRAGEGLALVIGQERRLLGTVTDGDVRRGLLAGVDLDAPVSALLRAESGRVQLAPITAPYGTDAVQLLRIMGAHVIRHVPLLDQDGRVIALALLSRLLRKQELPLRAVIMAGGFGRRLLPLTRAVPKPMLPVGNRPVLQHTLEQFSQAGIRQVHITTHYLAEKIREHVGDGAAFGLSVQYRHETEPLGTAGALRHLDGGGADPLLVINGDVLTTVNYRAMLEYHREHGAKLTVGVRQCSVAVPYGVVECDGSRVRQIREKPDLRFFCNAGIYLVEPSVCRSIPADRRTDMTDVIEAMLAAGEPVVSFPIHEYWLDIGKLDDYERAQLEMGGGRLAG